MAGQARSVVLLGGLTASGALSACVQVPAHPASPARATPTAAPPDAPASPERAIVVTIASLTPVAYLGSPGSPPDMPFLASRAAAGVAADSVDAVAPAAPRPVHATLLTGRLPSHHGVTGELMLNEFGAADPAPSDGFSPRGPTLVSAARERGLRTALLGWPASAGLAADLTFPERYPADVAPWPALLQTVATPAIRDAALKLGGDSPGAGQDGPQRDALLVGLVCETLRSAPVPQLVLVHLSQTAAAVRAHGPDAPETRASFSSVDTQLRRLVECVDAAGLGRRTAFFVAGDGGAEDVHAVLEPNVVLAEAGLVVPSRTSAFAVQRWAAYARPAGGSAFVHAGKEADAVLARRALSDATAATGAFRIVTADEMVRRGADPEAWFGLDAEPGYQFGAGVQVPAVHAAAERGGAGYFSQSARTAPGFVAFGAGVRERVRIPRMRQIDVAPTVASLLGLSLDAPGDARSARADGIPLVGALENAPTPGALKPVFTRGGSS